MNLSEITAEWLSKRFRRVVVTVEPKEPFESQQANWTPLSIRFDDGTTKRILYKQYKPDGFEWGLKERGFYVHCSAEMEWNAVAVCYDHDVDESRQTAWFLFEDLSETHRPHTKGEHEQEIRLAIPTLVELHARWWEDEILELDALKAARGGACRMANACSPENIRVQANHWLHHELPLSREKIGATFTDEMTDLCTRAIVEWPDLLIYRIGDGSQNDRGPWRCSFGQHVLSP